MDVPRKSNRFYRLSRSERKRRKREALIIIGILIAVAVFTMVENRLIRFGAEIPISNTILMFILININLLLLILLIFLVFRNLVKLFYDRKRKVMGSRLRTRLVIAFITLTLLPMTVLFFFSINFITTSIEFWFNVPVEQALENSIQLGRQFYRHAESQNQFFLERVIYQIEKKKYLDAKNRKAFTRYIQISQREFHLDAIEIYDNHFSRITFAVKKNLSTAPLPVVSANEFQKILPKQRVTTFSQPLASGELVRTIAAVPLDGSKKEPTAFAVISVFFPGEWIDNLGAVSKGFEEYQQVKLLKKPIQTTYYITLSVVALLVVFCAIWFGFYMAKTITTPIMELAEGTRRIAEGDLTVQIDMVADDEIGALVDAFNQMTMDLRQGHEKLELSARILRQQNIEIEERRRYMEIVLNNVSTGVITLDAEGGIATINQSAEKMLSLESDQILHQSYRQVLSGDYLKSAEKMLQGITKTPKTSVEIPLKINIAGRPRSFLVIVNALHDEGGSYMGAVMVFDDLTELEKGQRMAAWREVARRIAHEVKNPLTPISLSAQRLKRKYSEPLADPIFDECTQVIIDHVDLIRNLVNEFSAFARFPTADPKPMELPPIIEETVALYREGHPDIRFGVHIAEELPVIHLDRQQIKQAMINLVDNAIAAIIQKGRIDITVFQDPILKKIRIEVADDGPGISNEDKTRLFEPNFSTKKSGMGLGLTIVNSIVADHNGMISVQDNQPKGAKFVIELPF